MEQTLNQLRKKKLDLLKVQFKGKSYTLDLSKELGISEISLNKLISDNPANYGLISLIKSEAIAKRDQLEREKDSIFSKIYVQTIESNPKATKELANHKANASTKYQIANDKYLEAKEYADRLVSICRAFEMKAQLLQTFSSNIRKE